MRDLINLSEQAAVSAGSAIATWIPPLATVVGAVGSMVVAGSIRGDSTVFPFTATVLGGIVTGCIASAVFDNE